jgi:hypothetical protein
MDVKREELHGNRPHSLGTFGPTKRVIPIAVAMEGALFSSYLDWT